MSRVLAIEKERKKKKRKWARKRNDLSASENCLPDGNMRTEAETETSLGFLGNDERKGNFITNDPSVRNVQEIVCSR